MPSRVLFVSKPVVAPFHDGTKCLVRDVSTHFLRYRAVLMATPGAPAPVRARPECVEPEMAVVYAGSGAYTPTVMANARAALWLVLRSRADVWHFVFAPNPRTSAVGRVARRIRRVPTVQTIASPPRRFDPSLFFGDVVVAQSSWTKERVLEAFALASVRAPRVFVIPPPVGEVVAPPAERVAEIRHELALPDGAQVVVYPGDLETSRGAALVAASVRDVAAAVPRVVFVFACRHKTAESVVIEGELRRSLDGLPVRFVAETDLLALYGAASLVLFPVDDLYGKVDLPISLLEAMRLGVPVIAANVGPLSDLEGVHGVSVDGPEALTRETIGLLQDSPRRAELIAEGRAAVERRYDAAVVALAYEELYDELLRGGVGGAGGLSS